MAEPWVDGGMDGGMDGELALIEGSAHRIAQRPFCSETEMDLALLIMRLAALMRVVD